MTTRQQIVRELNRRHYPQTPAMLSEKLGKGRGTVQLLCRLLAMEDRIVERRFHGAYWYAGRASSFSRRPYRVEYNPRGKWVVFLFAGKELGGRQAGAHAARHDHVPHRLVTGDAHRPRVICEWNAPEVKSWQEGKRTLVQLRKVLRDQSNSQIEAFRQGLTSPH